MVAKKGITSPSRGLSQHHSHTQMWTEKHLSLSTHSLTHSLSTHSLTHLISTSGLEPPKRQNWILWRQAWQQSPPPTSEANGLVGHRTIAPHASMQPRLWTEQSERKAESGKAGGAYMQGAQNPQLGACIAWRLIKTYLRQNTGDKIKLSRF